MEMQSCQHKQQKAKKKSTKKKNKWISDEPQQEIINQKDNEALPEQIVGKKYQKISELQQKYKFDINQMIGSGFASSVYLGEEISTKKTVCIKVIDLTALKMTSSKAAELLHQEMESMDIFKDSEFIVNLYDIYESPTFYYIVMQLCSGGDLYKMLKCTSFNLPIKFVHDIVNQIALGLKEIHEKQMIHRDLKTENILIVKYPQTPEEKLIVKLGDLGFCVKKQKIQDLLKKGEKAMNLGSPIYMAPEIALSENYSEASDIYALGIIWYELLHRVAPWQALTQAELTDKKNSQQIEVWRQDIPQSLRNFLIKILSKYPEDRPPLTQLIAFLSEQDLKPEQ